MNTYGIYYCFVVWLLFFQQHCDLIQRIMKKMTPRSCIKTLEHDAPVWHVAGGPVGGPSGAREGPRMGSRVGGGCGPGTV